MLLSMCAILIVKYLVASRIGKSSQKTMLRIFTRSGIGFRIFAYTKKDLSYPSPVGARSASHGIIPAACKMLSVLCKLTAIQAATESE